MPTSLFTVLFPSTFLTYSFTEHFQHGTENTMRALHAGSLFLFAVLISDILFQKKLNSTADNNKERVLCQDTSNHAAVRAE